MNFVPFLEPLFAQSHDDEDITLQVWRERVFSAIMALGSFAGFFIVLITIYNTSQRGSWVFLVIYIAVYFWLVSITFIRRLPYNLRAGSLVLLLYLLGILSSFETAHAGDGRIWLVGAPILAAIFIRGRVGLILSGLSFMIWMIFGLLFSQEILPFGYKAIETIIQPDNWSAWFGTGLTFLVISIIVVSSISAILNNLFSTLRQSNAMAVELDEQRTELENQTQTFRARSSILETATEISRAISLILDPERLLFQAAKLIEEQFDLVHVGILTIIPRESQLALQASSGGFGQNLPALNTQFPANEGPLGQAISSGQAKSIVIGEDDDAAAFPFILSGTKAIAILPLRARQEVLGMITLQSSIPSPFENLTLNSLQILADQIAILLSNAELLAAREAALDAERKAYGEQSQSAWQDFLRSRGSSGYRRDQNGLSKISATEQGQPADHNTIQSLPIRIRGQIIGYIDVEKSETAGPWSSGETEMLSTITDRLEAALDTARLYEMTQRRASFEQITREITTQVRETLNVETILKTATREIQKSLNLAEVEVRMGTDKSESEINAK
jgi:GAF domain-containing protein